MGVWQLYERLVGQQTECAVTHALARLRGTLLCGASVMFVVVAANEPVRPLPCVGRAAETLRIVGLIFHRFIWT